ncbi:YbhB/YbcL family Raf kinase inhibitor-like protein [Opitutaceae bacterium EW11]|nr:YbhB/YbcL family Raf kinase inhibitor-like protein [Opitutaceae bacterium EW11]
MRISSPAFQHGEPIPEKYSRAGDDRTPPLEFEGAPPEARSLVLVMDDPDTSHGTFTHWIVFNIDPATRGFRENDAPEEVRFGCNDWGEADYGGPRPPNGEHRYFFRLYALDCRLTLPNGASRRELEQAMEGHVVANAETMGTFAAPGVSVPR